ncbi:DNA-3-methyladenine glycosylase family protein [Rhodalgimonas zhirmunskyi]|uniref:DNA-3-methyladenine glycosylase II n=1 Tax=Rhodalgimonas zhirmunskyi TaxID=2964767 RepID=A0AAJ1UA28_9RHOB|nr:DNA-3-methyladenine glycosylase 2 family protein [Rhodoalgimonas zhirmunskyi]MDQ2092522.1 DNA-3-methyladenine glycosylase 2 family protein [Rhodoalgimonas zhirmunskyi]
MEERIIQGPDCVAEGAAWLAARDAGMARAAGLVDEIPLRLRADGFEALLNAIVSQQVSVASAAAIWKRVVEAGLLTPEAVLAAGDEGLRGVGLSRPKVRYAQTLANAGIDYAALRQMPASDVIRILTSVTGIGVWTAEIYVMFSLGRADVFAPGDLALQEAARGLYQLKERPKEAALREMAQDWAPWRSVAARLLWAYYRVEKQREGIA